MKAGVSQAIAVATVTDFDRLTDALRRLVPLENPACESDLLEAEKEFGVPFPASVREFYQRANGTYDSTPSEHGWTRLWPLAEWRPVAEIAAEPIYSDLRFLPVVADHCQESWYYVLELRPGGANAGAVYIVDGVWPGRVVASSFEEFVAKVIEDHVDIYRKDPSAG